MEIVEVERPRLNWIVTIRVKGDGDYPVSVLGVVSFYSAIQEALDSFVLNSREDLEVIRVEVT